MSRSREKNISKDQNIENRERELEQRADTSGKPTQSQSLDQKPIDANVTPRTPGEKKRKQTPYAKLIHTGYS